MHHNLQKIEHSNHGDIMFDDIFKSSMTQIDDVIIRALFSLVTLFLVTKLLGKKQVSQLSVFDYVIGISIGNFAAEMTTNVDIQFMNGIVAVIIFGLVAYLVSVLTMKSIVLRRFFMGTPTILIEKGKLLEKGLKKVKFDINDLLEECRGNGYFDISQIEYAIMEVSGKISILPKSEYKPLTVSDMQLKVPQEGLCANVIIDGKIMHHNLEHMQKDEKWLLHELKIKGFTSLDSILLATLDENEKINIYERNRDEEIKQVLE